MKLYSVKNWQQFENNRTRELKSLAWVPIPNKHDGLGYRTLLHHKDGVAHYGAWCVLLQVASKCDPRGILSQDGAGIPQEGATKPQEGAGLPQAGAMPLTEQALALKTGVPEEIWKAALPRFVSIGWLVASDCAATIPQEGAGIPQEGAVKPQDSAAEQKGMEEKRIEENTPLPPKGARTRGKSIRVDSNTPLMIQIGALFNRQPNTLWTQDEAATLKAINPTDEEVKLISDYYSAYIPEDKNYRRRDLKTLLNNWTGELDRANEWQYIESKKRRV